LSKLKLEIKTSGGKVIHTIDGNDLLIKDQPLLFVLRVEEFGKITEDTRIYRVTKKNKQVLQ
jgi:hypothetical protein